MAPTRSGANKPLKRRGRPPGSRNSVNTPRSSNNKVAKERGRPSSSRTSLSAGKAGVRTKGVKNGSGNGRRGNDEEGPEESSGNKSSGGTRGRPGRARSEDAEEVDELSMELTRMGVVPTPTQRPGNRERADQSSSARKRGRPSNGAKELEDVEKSKAQKYVQLAPRTKRIAQEVIETWPQVSPPVLAQILQTLRDAKKDIVNTQRDEQRAITADETLGSIVRMLHRQLSDSRIPPQAKDIHFNIDKLTERYTHLFRELTTERHSHQLLTEQVKVAQHLLKKDEEGLDQLKKNARDWKARWKQQEKQGRLHPLLKDLNTEIEGDGPDDIGFKQSRGADVSMIDSPDSDLAPLLEQLRRSLESMQGNHEQVAGIDVGMRNAQVALDDVLFKHASAEQYAAL